MVGGECVLWFLFLFGLLLLFLGRVLFLLLIVLLFLLVLLFFGEGLLGGLHDLVALALVGGLEHLGLIGALLVGLHLLVVILGDLLLLLALMLLGLEGVEGTVLVSE